MGTPREATILHADLDAFYASVEQMLDPRLRGRPIAVGGGVVLAASYEARAYGVRGGMPTRRARELCPGLRVVGGHFSEYQRLGDEVMAILRDVSPLVERVSIDEAFVDVSGARRLLGEPPAIAAAIRRRVRAELDLPISVGVASTKHLAKVASQVAKPDGLVVVAPGEEEAFLGPLPVGVLWGVGPVTEARLESRGIRTVGQLVATDRSRLERLLGTAVGRTVHDRASNVDRRAVATRGRNRSMGAQSALGRRRATPELLHVTLGHLADRVTARMRRAGLAGRTITVRVRFPDLRSVTRSTTVEPPVAATTAVRTIGVELATRALRDHPTERDISLLGLSVSGLVEEQAVQLELDLRTGGGGAGAGASAARRRIDDALDAVRDRFGRDAVGRARVQLRERRGVPDAFRELAEKNGEPGSDGS